MGAVCSGSLVVRVVLASVVVSGVEGDISVKLIVGWSVGRVKVVVGGLNVGRVGIGGGVGIEGIVGIGGIVGKVTGSVNRVTEDVGSVVS